MEYHFLLNGQSVEIATSKRISQELQDMFILNIRHTVRDMTGNMQAVVTAEWNAFITNLSDSD
jgi:hypothetical protein